MANRPRSPGSVEVRRPSRAVSLDDARNPEVGGSNADRELLEGLFMDATEGGDVVEPAVPRLAVCVVAAV